jgi:hypothetical protein
MTQKVPPIHARMARDHLRLSRECQERAFELDPTLRNSNMSRRSSVATRRRHAFDEGGPKLSDLREAHGNLKEACDSLGEMLENKQFSFAGARDHCKSAMDCARAIHDLLGGGEDFGNDLDTNRADPVAAANASEEKRDRLAEEARGGVGGPPARNLLKNVCASPDRRKDFNSIAQGGADSAMGFDYNALLQRDPDDPRFRSEVFAARFNNRNSKPPVRKARKSPQHAQDTRATAPDDYVSLDLRELFQVDR